MTELPDDIFTEPDLDPNTLANLGPLTAMAGIWEGTTGVDVHPVAAGSETDTYVERYELQPTDPQTNGPQWFYGLRYHIHITKPGEVETFHDQVGYWLWEPAANTVIQTIAIPRGQVALLSGPAEPDAEKFTLAAHLGSTVYGICSNPFLDLAFKTTDVEVNVELHADGTWSYDETTTLVMPDRDEPFLHTDRHTLTKVADPTPNPLARANA
ncbi:MAG: FABP family protein [Acidimicrobiia bacterium]|nr:FABP family protein [Acidimicrobiia bacterium]